MVRGIRDRGVTVLLVEHDMPSVMRISDRVVVINFGIKIAQGTPAEIIGVEASYTGRYLKPLLARETTRETTLAGEPLEAGTQVMLLNVFNHRDPDHVEDADSFKPERWAGGERDYRFNHLSNGTQDCPGAPLVLLLGKAAIGGVLARYGLALERPSLDPGKPLPEMLDFFDVCFSTRRGHRT
jgi:hypothetical protein